MAFHKKLRNATVTFRLPRAHKKSLQKTVEMFNQTIHMDSPLTVADYLNTLIELSIYDTNIQDKLRKEFTSYDEL